MGKIQRLWEREFELDARLKAAKATAKDYEEGKDTDHRLYAEAQIDLENLPEEIRSNRNALYGWRDSSEELKYLEGMETCKAKLEMRQISLDAKLKDYSEETASQEDELTHLSEESEYGQTEEALHLLSESKELAYTAYARAKNSKKYSSPGQEVHERALELSKSKGISYEKACYQILREDPYLGKKYIQEDGLPEEISGADIQHNAILATKARKTGESRTYRDSDEELDRLAREAMIARKTDYMSALQHILKTNKKMADAYRGIKIT